MTNEHIENNAPVADIAPDVAPDTNLESEAALEAVKADTEDESSENENSPFTPEQQKYVGKLLSEQRKRLKAEVLPKIEPVAAPQVESGMIYDSEIDQVVPIDSYAGQQAEYRRLAEAKKARDAQGSLAARHKAEEAELTEKLKDGYDKFDNYRESLEIFSAHATPETCDALFVAKHPDAVIAYLADKKGEIQRIGRLSRGEQAREIYRIEDTLSPRKKMVSTAPAPMTKTKSGAGAKVSNDEMTMAQLKDFYEKKYNPR